MCLGPPRTQHHVQTRPRPDGASRCRTKTMHSIPRTHLHSEGPPFLQRLPSHPAARLFIWGAVFLLLLNMVDNIFYCGVMTCQIARQMGCFRCLSRVKGIASVSHSPSGDWARRSLPLRSHTTHHHPGDEGSLPPPVQRSPWWQKKGDGHRGEETQTERGTRHHNHGSKNGFSWEREAMVGYMGEGGIALCGAYIHIGCRNER